MSIIYICYSSVLLFMCRCVAGVVRRGGGVKNINIMNSIASAVYMYFQIFASVKPTDTLTLLARLYF